jgi:general secretion pathway protein D
MKLLRFLMTAALLAVFTVPANADAAKSAYKRGVQAERFNKYDEAFEAFKEAYQSKPKDPEYLAAYSRMRFYAAAEHVRAGQNLRDSGKLQEALVEYQKAATIDTTNVMAQQEIRQTTDLLKKQESKDKDSVPVTQLQSPLVKMAEQAAGPVELQFTSNSPITLRLAETADVAYKIVGKLAGINVLFDPEFKAQRLSVELNDVTPREALDMVALQSKTFWQPVSANTIMVAADTPGKRKDRQSNIMTTFYLRNVSTASDLQDAANTVKSILDLSRVQLIPRQNAIVMRGTADQLVLAQKLLSDIDKPKPEVVIDIVVMQIRRDRTRKLGIDLPTSASVALVPGGGVGATGGNFTINSLRNINATNFQVGIPGATLTALMTDGNTKIIQNPEIRALDNEKATLKIGDRIPIATGSFSGGGGASVSPLVNTQFQYIDVGVNIDITPHIHSEREVTLKMTLEISSVTGSQNLGGVTQPIIGQRRIEHELRLRDGDINLVGGILEESEVQSLSGYPGLSKIPILKYLFGQENKEMRENEVVFAITPHIIRAQDLNEQNLRPIDIGTGSLVEMRHPAPDVPANSTAKSTPRVAPGGGSPAAKTTRTVGANPPAPAAAPTAAPTTASPPPQLSTNAAPSKPTAEAYKADGPSDSCPKGATPDHPIGCYLNGGWRVDVGDGRGYQIPAGATGATGPTVQPSPGRPPATKGATGAADHLDPKGTPVPAGPLV